MRAERWAEAVAELEKVTRLDPNVAEAYYQLGRAYVRLKRTADAQAALATFKRLSETQKEREETELREVVTPTRRRALLNCWADARSMQMKH